MKVWIVNPYATLPTEPWREDRHQILSQKLNNNGYEVTVWTSNFIHRSKQYRSNGWNTVKVSDGYNYNIIPVSAYSNHISLKRIIAEVEFSKFFFNKSFDYPVPDVIILAEPSIFFSFGIKKYIKLNPSVKLIVDVIDIWPELFNVIFPHSLRFLGKLLFLPFYYQRYRLFKKADGIVTVAENYRQIVLKYISSKPVEVVYWGVDTKNNNKYDTSSFPDVLVKEKGEYWILYAGTLGSNYDIQSILKAGLLIENEISNCKIIIIGDGNLRGVVEETIKKNNLKKTIYLGSMSSEELQFFYQHSDIGISSYVEDSTVAMPIKAYDYMINGLPLVNSLKRDLGDLVTNNQIGIQYKAGDAYSLYTSIMELGKNRIKRDAMSERMKKIVLQFDYDVQYGKYVTFIQAVVFGKSINKLQK